MVQFEKPGDAEIIRRILDGEKELYEIIVRRLNAYLYKVGRSYNYNHEDTQDLMQETFIDAFRCLSQFEGRANFKTWIVRIMMNNCYRKRMKSSFKNEIMQDVSVDAKPMFINGDNDTESEIHSRELGRVIEDALREIPIDYRMTFSLREINGFNVAETADLLHISQANVKVRLNRAKIMLRREIEKTYSATELFEFNAIYCNAMVEKVMEAINKL